MSVLLLLGSFALLMAGHGLRIRRWSRFIGIYEQPPTGALVRALSLGFALNYVLPFKLGDLCRAWYAGRRMKSGVGLSLATVIVDRFLDVLAREGKRIRSFPTDVHISFGTPAEYALAAEDPRLLEVERT